MSHDPFRQTGAHGAGKASRVSEGIVSPNYSRVISEYHSLRTDEARAAFADKWLSLAASRLDDSWPVIYKLLALVRDRELYRLSWAMQEDGRTYESFEDYFRQRIGQAFERWLEMEQTYRFCEACKPELFERPYGEAVEAKNRAQRLAADPEVKPAVTPSEAGAMGGRGKKAPDDNRSFSDGSTSVDRIVRRLKRDAPEIADALGRGEYPSARAAGIAAGIIKVPTVLDILRKAWAKATPEERRQFLSEIEPIKEST